MSQTKPPYEITDVIGSIPNRMALAGGWIDQPFISRFNPNAPGSMVVVCLEPTFRVMDRCGMSSSTRRVAMRLWNGKLPQGDMQKLMHDLYKEENIGSLEPSGSQDMAGIIYPGINRLDYDYAYEDGYFPVHIESNNDPEVAAWLESVLHMVPIGQRPAGYNPLGEQHLDREWIRRLGQSGKDCFDTIVSKDIVGLGASMNECMKCWEALLPHVVRHPTITFDLMALLKYYQDRYRGAMFSGCGGGYFFVISEEPVPGSFKVKICLA